MCLTQGEWEEKGKLARSCLVFNKRAAFYEAA